MVILIILRTTNHGLLMKFKEIQNHDLEYLKDCFKDCRSHKVKYKQLRT